MNKKAIGLCLLFVTSFLLVNITSVKASEEITWNIQKVHAPDIWEREKYGTKGYGIKIAIVDSGIDKNHEDLANNVKGGVSFIEGKEWWEDASHGTYCAGIVAAEHNDLGVVGVAPEASLYAVKVNGGEGTYQTLAEGINWCVDNDIDIISMSLSTGDWGVVEQACERAYNNGLLIMAAAGDTIDASFVLWPAKYGTVIAVGATDSNDQLWSRSPSGPEMEFVAPGVDVKSTVPGGYETHFGTSCSSPHVAGLAALIWASPIDYDYDFDDDGEWDNNEVRKKLQDSAYDLGAAGRDESYGFGLIDASARALNIDSYGQGAFAVGQTKTIEISQTSHNGQIRSYQYEYAMARTIPQLVSTIDLWVGQYWSMSYTVQRTFLYFNTTMIPSDAIIIDAYLILYGSADELLDWKITIQKWTDDIPIWTTDFNEFDNVRY